MRTGSRPRPLRRHLIYAGRWMVLVALGTVPLGAQSQTPDDTFQPWHAVMYRSVLSADISPDGRQIAFLRSQPRRPLDDDSGPAWVELYVLDADGREVPFVTGEVNVGRPRWLATDELAFLDRREGDEHRAVYRISTRGGEAKKVERWIGEDRPGGVAREQGVGEGERSPGVVRHGGNVLRKRPRSRLEKSEYSIQKEIAFCVNERLMQEPALAPRYRASSEQIRQYQIRNCRWGKGVSRNRWRQAIANTE